MFPRLTTMASFSSSRMIPYSRKSGQPGPSQPQFTMHMTPQTLSAEGGLTKHISRSPGPTFTRHPPLPPPACLWCWLFQSGLGHAPLVRGFLLVCPYYCDLTRNSPNTAFYTPGDWLALSHPAATEQRGHRGRLGASETLLRTYSPRMSSQEALYAT